MSAGRSPQSVCVRRLRPAPALSTLNALRVRNAISAGAGLLLLLPIGTAIYGAGAGVVAGLAFPRRGRLIAFALPVLSVAWALARLYLDPPVFAYDPFGGYFPGPIYDAALRPSSTLFLFRLTNLVWIATPLGCPAAAVSRPGTSVPAPAGSARPLRPSRPGPVLTSYVRRWRPVPPARRCCSVIHRLSRCVQLGFHMLQSIFCDPDCERRRRVILRHATVAASCRDRI